MAYTPGNTGGSGSSSSGSSGSSGTTTSPSLSTQQLLVAGLLLLFLLVLANSYPKYVVGFMLLVLTGVILAHSSEITGLFNG